MSPPVKIIIGIILGALLTLIDATFAWWILSWLMISFAHWFQLALVVHGLVGSSLILHEFKNSN